MGGGRTGPGVGGGGRGSSEPIKWGQLQKKKNWANNKFFFVVKRKAQIY